MPAGRAPDRRGVLPLLPAAGLAAVLPCFVVYLELGAKLQGKSAWAEPCAALRPAPLRFSRRLRLSSREACQAEQRACQPVIFPAAALHPDPALPLPSSDALQS